jgi:L-ascorbate metabolism protein UlaG (beta-lactamase superfamily)
MKLFLVLKYFVVVVIGLLGSIFVYERLFLVGKQYSGDKTTHLQNGEFFIPDIAISKTSFIDILKWNFGERNNVAWTEPYTTEQLTLSEFDAGAYAVRSTFINHATILIETEKHTILTDPVFSKRVSPFSFAGPARHHDPYVPLSALKELDYVLISHGHYDHLSVESVEMIEEKFTPHYIVPLNNAQFLEKAGVQRERITELDLFESYTNDDKSFSTTLEKAQHWSARGFSDRRRYLWGSFVIETAGRTLFFAGDTGYGAHFSDIKSRYNNFDIAYLPIGAYEPRWVMKNSHMNPEEAVQAGIDLGQPPVIGIHFGTFKITDEGRHDPERHTKEALQKTPYNNTFLVPTISNGLQILVK